MSYLALSNKNEEELNELRRRANQLITTHKLKPLRNNPEDIATLQDIYDTGLVTALKQDDMIAFGVVFGDLFCSVIPDLTWVSFVELADQTELQPYCLRYKNTSLALYPIETYVVPIELGDEVDVQQAFDEKIAILRMFISQHLSLPITIMG